VTPVDSGAPGCSVTTPRAGPAARIGNKMAASSNGPPGGRAWEWTPGATPAAYQTPPKASPSGQSGGKESRAVTDHWPKLTIPLLAPQGAMHQDLRGPFAARRRLAQPQRATNATTWAAPCAHGPGERFRLAAADGSAAIAVLEAFRGRDRLLEAGPVRPRSGPGLRLSLDSALRGGTPWTAPWRWRSNWACSASAWSAPSALWPPWIRALSSRTKVRKRLREACRQCLRARPPTFEASAAFTDAIRGDGGSFAPAADHERARRRAPAHPAL